MSSKGKEETKKLKENLEEQLQRLLHQLADIEESKDEIDASEYEEVKADTMEQLQELNGRLSKMGTGDITLVDEISAMQLATQSAISAAFRTPEVIRMFAKKEPEELRQRLAQVDRDIKLGHITPVVALPQKVEILSALRQLKEKLTPEELKLLSEHSNNTEKTDKNSSGFVQISEQPGIGDKVLGLADDDLKTIKQA
ncbi:protein LZIC-like [Lycorma delicatula]|uniref:protein LZIC-like n=1 Tax=Lycorma delicatula TaxID=130591 RepID=UPI003F51A886